MKLHLLNTVQGLKPLYDDDFDEKKKLKIGEVYTAEVKRFRSLEHHRKYFSLINTAWAYQNEKVENHFNHSVEAFRKTVEIAAGWYEPIYSIERKEWIHAPKSISFEKMGQDEFNDLYSSVKRVLFNTFLRNITEEEFMKNLINY